MMAKLTKGERLAAKINELASLHGRDVRRLIRTNRTLHKQIDNFFGRHPVRREAILARMRQGDSYTKAYKATAGMFDTKNWEKVLKRAAACRGLLLTTTLRVAKTITGSTRLTSAERRELRQLAEQLSSTTTKLIRCLVCCELMAPVRLVRTKKGSHLVREVKPSSFSKMRGYLATAKSKMEKNCRDVPKMAEMLGKLPSVHDAARIAVEVGRILCGVPLLLDVLEGRVRAARKAKVGIRTDDRWGVGSEYACQLREDPADVPLAMIVTHRDPDADALTAVWLADRYLLSKQACRVQFVDRSFKDPQGKGPTCVVDVGCEYDPSRLRFDHKPPAFNHRDEECATSLVWRHARKLRQPVKHLEGIVRLVHDGDAARRRQSSDAYQESCKTGLHALIRCARAYSQSDQMLYKAIAVWLDELSQMELQPDLHA